MSGPIYESVIAACKCGCFGCGAVLDPTRARLRKSVPPSAASNLRSWRVECERCGDVLDFATYLSPVSRPPVPAKAG